MRGAVLDDDDDVVSDSKENDFVSVPLVVLGGGCSFDCGGSLLFFSGERFRCVDFCHHGVAPFERVHQFLGGNSYIQGTQEQDEIFCDVGRGDWTLLDFAGALI